MTSYAQGKGIDKAKQKAKEFKDSGQYDELKDKAKDYYGKAKDYVQSGQASDKAKEWYGKAKEYVNSGSASSDLQSLIDSLSSYGVGGSTGDVNASSGDSTGVYANVTKDQALDELASLRIEPGNERGYDRGEWRHWVATSEAPGGGGLGRKGCFDVREQVLARQGQNVKLVDNGCEVQATLNDPYTGTNGHTRKDMQIDHSVPLGYAYAHGGRNWSAQQKQTGLDAVEGHGFGGADGLHAANIAGFSVNTGRNVHGNDGGSVMLIDCPDDLCRRAVNHPGKAGAEECVHHGEACGPDGQ